MALSSGAIQIYQGSARNTVQPNNGKKLNYKSTLYVVVDDVTGACCVYESLSNSDVQKPAGTVTKVNKRFTKVGYGAGSFVPAAYGDYKQVFVFGDVREAGIFGLGDGAPSGAPWNLVAKKNAAYKAGKGDLSTPVGAVLYTRKDGGASLKVNKGLTKDAGATLVSGIAAMDAYLAKKNITAL